MKLGPNFSRGTVSLVALCFVAVLGIALSSYLAICSRSMTLSNRTFQSGLSQQLAELGLEEGLRAFNKGDWGGWSANPSGITGATTAWTLDTTKKRASRTLTFDSTRLGQNVTATVKIRVDNYDARQIGPSWNSATTYSVNALIGRNGIWYRCIRGHTNQQPPNMNYWVPEGFPWRWDALTTYAANDMISYAGTWYRCKSINTNRNPPGNATYWQAITYIYTTDPGSPYVAAGQEAILDDGANWVQLTNATYTWGFAYSWQWSTGRPFSYNDVTRYNGVWYRCLSPHTSDWSSNSLSNTTEWQVLTNMWSWASTLNYNLNDVVYSGSSWYRCIRANSGRAPNTNPSYWVNVPPFDPTWDAGKTYSQNDTVRYKGVWYLSIASGHTGQVPTDASSGYWAAALLAIQPWNSSAYYDQDDLVSNGGIWYRCIAAHKNQTPPNASYWTVLTGSSTSYVWSAGTAYSAGAYRSYGGVWYKCLTATAANDGHTPNDSAYWTPTWAQPSDSSLVTGAPVVYAESSITIAGSPPSKTQLRAPIAPAPLFPNAVGATSAVIVTGGSAGTVDSYDGSTYVMSNLGTYSNYTYNQNTGAFSTAANTGYSAVLAAAGTANPSLTVGNSATVKGYTAAASTSSFASLSSFGTSASLQNSDGTVVSALSGATNVDATRISTSPYIPVFTTLPISGTSLPTSELASSFSAGNFPAGSILRLGTTTDIGTPGATTPSIYYYNSSLLLGNGMTLNINGPVILYVNGYFRTNNSGGSGGTLVINSTGSAEIHFASSLRVYSGSGGFINRTKDPKKLIFIGDVSSTTLFYLYPFTDPAGIDNNFYGAIYTPNSTAAGGFTVYTNSNIYGAISAKNVTFNTEAKVHYDTSLRYATFGGVDQPYAVMQWRELPLTEQATMP